jgi:hypothetical protein
MVTVHDGPVLSYFPHQVQGIFGSYWVNFLLLVLWLCMLLGVSILLVLLSGMGLYSLPYSSHNWDPSAI